jgi:hypothetical protein
VANRMRLNTSKCKVLHISGTLKQATPDIKLDGQTLEVVSSYRYLGIDLNEKLQWDQQWSRVQFQISSYPYLVKQLKRNGFKENILVNTNKSFFFSHLNYSSPALAATSERLN